MRSSWPSRFLLPAAQVLAEGGWLAVVYAALQALVGEVAWLGPLELTALAWAGMAWGRRRRWRTPAAEAAGLPLLALAAGAFGWLVDPQVRQLLVAGEPLAAAGLHVPGWIGAVAFWRGEVHRSAEDDDAIQDRLLRWAVPGLAVPWVAGHLATDGIAERDFTTAAFVGTIFFVGAAFTALGLARLEAVRASTGSDWRSNRSWLVLVLGIAVAVTAVAFPAAIVLDVPARSLLGALLGPMQLIFVALVLITTPIIVLAAGLAELIGPYLPEGFGLGQIDFPDFTADTRQAANELPVLIFYVVVALIVTVELLVVAVIVWLRWQERKRTKLVLPDAFEERSIVIPEPSAAPPRAAAAPRRRGSAGDPVSDAYLRALDALRRDGRWERRAEETPAAHVRRTREAGLALPAFARLAAAYQLVRYGSRGLTRAERNRSPRRLRALRRRLNI